MKLGSIIPIGRTLSKFCAGLTGDTDGWTNIVNAAKTLRYLVSNQMGFAARTTLSLGYGSRRHDWAIEDRNDISILEEVFLNEEYALDISPPENVLDLGANFGAASIYFALKWPDAQIVAVEPNPVIFERLARNTAAYSNITCFRYAAGGADGTATFSVGDSHVGSSFVKRSDGARSIDVQVRSLSSIMAEAGIEHVDVLKFDIEGAEEFVFADRQALRKVGVLVGEVHPDLMTLEQDEFMAMFSNWQIHQEPLENGRYVLKGEATAR